MTTLARPLTLDQIAAANELYGRSRFWQLIDHTLADLHRAMPGFGPKAVLAKTCAIDKLYSTNVPDVPALASHVSKLLLKQSVHSTGPELVERLAHVSMSDGRERHLRSFASKFASVFIDSDRFPILDSLAVESLLWHLEQMPPPRTLSPTYLDFMRLVQALEERCGFDRVHRRRLDRYLWLAAHYRRWRAKPDATYNAEAKRLFEDDLAAGGTCGNQLAGIPTLTT